MRAALLAVALVLLLLKLGASQSASDGKPAEEPKAKPEAASEPKSKLEAYQKAVDTMAENINKATEKSEALIDKHMSAVDKDPGALITKESMQKLMSGSSFLPQKAGTRSIMLEAQQGFNGISNYQPSSWKITETMSGPTDKKPEPSGEKQPVYTYPAGLGPVLLNGCTGNNYNKSSPCYDSRVTDLVLTLCLKMMDAANYIGVGFDGRGYYRADSRRGSLIQRSCVRKTTFMGQDVPDTMNVFGIYETMAETKSFQSVDEYMSYIRNKAGLSEQKNLFTSEASKYSKASAFGVNLGGIGSIVGGAIGAFAGGPVGAAMGASLGGAIGGSIGGGSGSGSGKESATDKGQSSSKFQQNEQAAQKQSSSQNFFAIMYVNVILYEISLDDVKPTDINLAALKDYMSLPVSYYSAGADVKYQNFLLRWGTHFIRSAKFGGQLKITKTAKMDKLQSSQEFASIAETEFQSMFATLQSKWSQHSSSWGFLGIGGSSKSSSQSSNAVSESGYKGTLTANNQQSQGFRQSEFTQTTVEAQGGTPEIAEALVDFYTPAFKQLFHQWIVSIKDYAKPFEFQLRPINELFNLNMEALFPAGNADFGCVGGGSTSKVEVQIDPDTKQRYYIDKVVEVYNNITVEKKVRVNCHYSSIDEFKQDTERRMVSLERAVGVYMSEGPFPTSSFELQGGQPGCEEATLAQFQLFGAPSAPLKFADLSRQPFIIAFNLPEEVPEIITRQAKYVMTYRFDRWFAVEPNQQLVNLYDGCQLDSVKPTDTKVCFRNIILTYEESTGFFSISKDDFAASKERIPSLPYWLAGTTVARTKKMFGPSSGTNGTDEFQSARPQRAAIPCNVKWLNSHRLDPNKPENCIHFTAASQGDLFVIFASVPRDHSTWYYLQISPQGVNFHHAMSLVKSDLRKGMGMLGDKNLYQSFFVCVIQKEGAVTMQYGKADPDSEVGTVYAAYTFPPDSQFSRLTFYSFGAGNKAVSLMDVRQTKKMPEVACLGTEYIKKDGQCVLDCHAECNGCNEAKDNKQCQQCKNLRVETLIGDTKVTECVSQCPVGMYLSDSKTGLCVLCASGTFKATPGNQKCTQCDIGTSSPEGATSCAGCPAGTYGDSLGNGKCVKCPGGKYAATGAASCTDCPPGKFSEPGQAECNPCPYGHFGKSPGMSQCEQCPAGFYADSRGMTSCLQCPAGSSNPPGSRSCENNCGIGEFSPKLGVACAKCAPGSFAESRGFSVCTQCAVGTYQPNTGQPKCLIAPKGSFVSERGANAAQPCPAGTYGDLEGQSSNAVCKPCRPGTFSASAGSTTCSLCPRGQYQPSAGQTSCILTGQGYYTDLEGQTAQKVCAAGHISSSRGATGCSQCAAGKFAPAGSASCSDCTAFQYAPAGSGACTSCPYSGLVKSDRVNCYRRVFFVKCDSQGGTFSSDSKCSHAMDSNRGGMPYISQKNKAKSWVGVFAGFQQIRKLVLWRRLDCCPDQFTGLQVTAVTAKGPVTCGTVSTVADHVVLDCDHQIFAIIVSRVSDPWISLAEVEAYAD